jgi:hypothetical protein
VLHFLLAMAQRITGALKTLSRRNKAVYVFIGREISVY